VAGVDLSWAHSTGPRDGYHIFRSTDGTNFSLYAAVGPDVNTYTDNGTLDGTKYWYRVRAFTNAAGDSASANKDWAVTRLMPPTDLIASNLNDGTGAIKVSWQSASTQQTSFIIRRYAMVNGVWQTTPQAAITVGGDQSEYTFTDTAQGAQYQFTVQAVNVSQYSIETLPEENTTEPTQTWTNVYYNGTTPDYVNAEWSPPYYHQDPVT
jgi:hypothetical protein